jgi:DNA modification methylase/ParB-like chromosome segregation protein Spo0J
MKHLATDSLKLHPEAPRVPMMPAPQFEDFLTDVKERGIRVPIELQPGTSTVLDGRSRLEAARKAGLAKVPVTDANLNGDEPVEYMLRAALKRRHLSDDQRAALGNEIREYRAAQGRERQKQAGREGGNKGGRGKKKTPEAASSPRVSSPPRARSQAAKQANVSERKMKQAQKVKEADPALAEKVKQGEVKLAQAVREVQKEERLQTLHEKARAAEAERAKTATAGALPWKIRHGDCLQELSRLEPGCARLVFADPPYNIGIDYGDGANADRLSDTDFLEWFAARVLAFRRALTDDGSLWVLINDEYAAEFAMIFKGAGFTIRNWIKWYETFGVNCSDKFNRTSRHLFYCVKDPRRFVFNREAVNRPSDRQAKYADSRADPGGKILDDVWTDIPRLAGTAAERLPDFPTQLPLALLRRVVRCASDPGDLVIDPFNGSGTTGVAAVESGRKYVGIEREARFVELATQRLKGVQVG